MIDPTLIMLWWIAKVVAAAVLWTTVPAAIMALFYYLIVPDSKDRKSRDPDPRLATRLHYCSYEPPLTRPIGDVTVAAWETVESPVPEASTPMVEDACLRLRKGSCGQYFTATAGEDYTALFDISASAYLDTLRKDPDCYERLRQE